MVVGIKTMKVGTFLFLVAALMVIISVSICDDSDATTYGSSDVGACAITFNANGGSGGYTQWVDSGNSYVFPTERTIVRTGFVLVGWSTLGVNDGVATHYPGEISTDVRSGTYYAVWKPLDYIASDTFHMDADHIIVSSGSGCTLYPNESIRDLMGAYASGRGGTYTFAVAFNGHEVSSQTSTDGSSVSAHGFTLNMSGNTFSSVTGTVSTPGLYEISVRLETRNSDDVWCRWYVSAYDIITDPSVIHHITYNGENANDSCYGPIGTACKLPGAISGSSAQVGWRIPGTDATFYLGGRYDLGSSNVTIQPVNASFSDAQKVAGVIAFNAMGGSSSGPIASLIQKEGCTMLSESIPVRSGKVFIGWNPTGSASDPIYPAGYYYPVGNDDYIEMKAVWVDDASSVALTVRSPANGLLDKVYTAYSGYAYALPETGFDITGYTFLGWSAVPYALGEGVADVLPGTAVMVTSHSTYHAVYERTIHTATVIYAPNGGMGTMGQTVVTSYEAPFAVRLDTCAFVKEGYTFLGWSDVSAYEQSPSISDGALYSFTGTQTVTLYAVWSYQTADETTGFTFVLIYNGNGSGASSVPIMSVHTERNVLDHTFKISSAVPVRAGHTFLGWSDSADGPVLYHPGDSVSVTVETLEDGSWVSTSSAIELFAVWSVSHVPESGTQCTVTFVTPSSTRTVQIAAGERIVAPDTPEVSGSAFRGWMANSSQWDFDDPVTGDMVLTAEFFRVFTLESSPEGYFVSLLCTSDLSTVTFTDGHTETFYSLTSAPWKLEAGSTGTVKVTVRDSAGTVYTATAGYAVPHQEEDLIDDDPGSVPVRAGYIVGAVVSVLAVILIFRRFI